MGCGCESGAGVQKGLGGRAVHAWSRVGARWRFGVFLAIDEGWYGRWVEGIEAGVATV